MSLHVYQKVDFADEDYDYVAARPGIAIPDSYASTTAWTRSRSPSFISNRATCVFTVVSETISSDAISALDRPRATQRKTSSSRAVSSSSPGGGAGGVGAAAANSWI